jgi:cytosine/adenosine deaminase-related metal-dependent hydrolase
MNPTRDIMRGDLWFEDDQIVAVGPAPRAWMKAGAGQTVREIDARGCAVVPGLVQGHVHLCQVLMRGMADDLPLLEWLRRRIWPLEAAHSEASLYASARLGLLEMMLAGTTTILDMGTVHHHDAVMQACEESGIRALSGKAMMDQGRDVPKGLRETTRASLRESERLARYWMRRGNGRLRYAFAPRFILSCTEKLFRETAVLSRELGALLHSHASEHPGETAAVRKVFGADDVDVFERWGVLSTNTVLAHGVQLTPKQRRLLAKRGTAIVHCPSANLKLGSGIAAVSAMRADAMRVGLGADGAPCNNNLDPWQELRHAALLAKVKVNTTALPAREAFELATCAGAEVLGIGAHIGSLEPGKKADVVVVRIDGPHVEPGGDVYSRLVYAVTRGDVSQVFVDGVHVVRDGAHALLPAEAVVTQARRQAKLLSARAGLS